MIIYILLNFTYKVNKLISIYYIYLKRNINLSLNLLQKKKNENNIKLISNINYLT